MKNQIHLQPCFPTVHLLTAMFSWLYILKVLASISKLFLPSFSYLIECSMWIYFRHNFQHNLLAIFRHVKNLSIYKIWHVKNLSIYKILKEFSTFIFDIIIHKYSTINFAIFIQNNIVLCVYICLNISINNCNILSWTKYYNYFWHISPVRRLYFDIYFDC